jgi:eukaryotic-like serine/threonine-protein kinase
VTLAAGTRLGPYEILAPLGAGGMGEVYRARDTRLERTVAIKVLPPRLSSDLEFRRRFEREARAISQLSHPNICALYDVGREGDTDYLVMEYLEGETLAARIARGALPFDKMLRLGSQIADALERAHRAGIVHRDLKPSNVMLTKDGVKLLDFGLARKSSAAGRSADLTSAPTDLKETELTGQGGIAGTLQYMAPEQLEGKDADARTDIFAFGAVLYEMATGRKAFTGSSQASLITAIMSSQPPPIESVQPMTPPLLDRTVRRCLARDPDQRWQSAADVGTALGLAAEATPGEPGAVGSAGSGRSKWIAWGIAGAAILFAGFALWRARRPSTPPLSPTRFRVELPSSGSFTLPPPVGALAVSPDGRKIAFVAGVGTRSRYQLWLRSLDQVETTPVPGTEGAISPFWSPDGRYIAFFAGSKLKKVAVAGGPPQVICDSSSGSAGSWSPDGVILFNEWAEGRAGILRVSAEGGSPVLAVKPDDPSAQPAQGWPKFLPDGRRFLFLKGAYNIGIGGAKGVVCLGSLDSAEVRPLFSADSRAEYAPPGYLLFVRDGALLARPFDAKALAFTGDAIPVASGIWYYRQSGGGVFSVSADGSTLAFQPHPFESRLVWLDRDGRTLSAPGAPAVFQPGVRLSPDGRRVAMAVSDTRTGSRDIWIYDAVNGLPTRLTFEDRDGVSPVWSPDGSRLAFGSARKGPPDIYVRDLATGRDTAVVELPGTQLPSDWSPDGARIAYRDYYPAREPPFRIGIQVLGTPATASAPPATPFGEFDARFSPDGRWMSLVTEESGSPEAYVVPAGGGGRYRVSSSGGSRPRWKRDGRELYFLSTDGRLMAVAVSSGPAGLELGEPRVLFNAGPAAIDFDVASDGRFLFLMNTGSGGQPSLVVTENWASGLEKK